MSSELNDLSKLLTQTQFKPSDIEYIINYLVKEEITPQLAMRRIKTLDKVMERLEDNRDKEEIKRLKGLLEEKEEKIQTFENETNELGENLDELKSTNALLKTETEQLGEQLNSMQELHSEELEKEEQKRITMDTNIDVVAEYLLKIIDENEKMGFMLEPILALMNVLKGDKPVEWDHEVYVNSFNDFIEELEENAVADYKRGGVRTTSFRYGIRKPKEKKIEEEVGTPDPKKTEPKKESKISDDGVEEAKLVKEALTPITDNEAKQTEGDGKDQKDKVDDATIKVLNLFIEFIEEAGDNGEFQKRVAAICETDEAYVHLGSIALSQIYSYKSKGLEKKDEVLKLLNTWKESGVPW